MATVTPGKIFTANEIVTPTNLNALGVPTVSNIVTTDLANSSVTTAKIADSNVTTAKIADANVTTAKIADANVTSAKLAAVTQQALIPVGAVMPFAMNSAPTGWLSANGGAVSRSTYAALFAAVGTTHGAGDGSTTFNLPDLRGYFVRGSGTNADGTAGGTFATKQADAYKSHNHGGVTGTGTTGNESNGHTHSGSTGNESQNHIHYGTTGSESADHAHYVSGTTNSAGSHTHTQSGGGGADDGGPYVTGSTSGGTLSNISTAGDHTHTFAAWTGGRNTAHTHDFSTGGVSANHTHNFTTGGISANHTHSVPSLSISADGGTETRPKNIALLYCIKF